MNLRQLRDATIATEQPLTAVLRKAMVFAAQLESPLLHQWAQREISGYPKGARLPAYRRSRPVAVRGNFVAYRPPEDVRDASEAVIDINAVPEVLSGSQGELSIEAQLRDVPIAAKVVSTRDRHRLFKHKFSKPVAVYEDWLRTQTGELRAPWPRDALNYYSASLRANATCLEAWQVLSREALLGVVDGVRNGLLEFALELEREAPTAENSVLSEFAIAQERITQVFATTIYAGVNIEQPINVQGSTIGNLAGGRDNLVRQGDVSLTQQGVTLDVLLGALRAAVEQLPDERRDATRGLVEDLEEDVASPQPARHRLLRKLKAIAVIAGAAGSAGTAGTAVIDAVRAIQRALDS